VGRPETEAGHREWAERCERFADGNPTPADRRAASIPSPPVPTCPVEFFPYFVALVYSPRQVLAHLSAVAQALAGMAILVDRYFPEEWPAGCDLLRDVLGNPFRPARFSPNWRTDTVLSLARQMYDSRDFGAMPILADALQDAGCESADVLGHCRGPGPHVRGCWVVDLVLEKA
jgi:hypothetical protein